MAVELCPTKISDIEQKIKFFDRIRLFTKLEIMRMHSQPGCGTEADFAAAQETLAEVEEELRHLLRRHKSATSLHDGRD